MLNALNNDKLIAWDTTMTVDPNSALDANGLPTGYLQGRALWPGHVDRELSASAPGLTGGRTYMGAFGVRF